MKMRKQIFIGILVTSMGISFGACSKSDENKGSLEKAGRAADEALDKAKDKTGAAMEKAGESIKQAGEKMREGTKKTTE